MNKLPKNVETVRDFVACIDIQKLFRRKEPTLLNWRRDYGLPHAVLPSELRPSIRYRLSRVLAWARLQNLSVDLKVLQCLENGESYATSLTMADAVEQAKPSQGMGPLPPQRRRLAEIQPSIESLEISTA